MFSSGNDKYKQFFLIFTFFISQLHGSLLFIVRESFENWLYNIYSTILLARELEATEFVIRTFKESSTWTTANLTTNLTNRHFETYWCNSFQVHIVQTHFLRKKVIVLIQPLCHHLLFAPDQIAFGQQAFEMRVYSQTVSYLLAANFE